jgi:hypothetical protein
LLVLLKLGPESFVGRSNLTRNTTGHLSRQLKAGTQFLVGA